MPRLFQPLPEGPIDIIGDVHGEAEALLRLLSRLGVDVERRRAARPVVFVGDLVDRGPDSVTVVEIVSRLHGAGLAHCVAGNHELNALAGESKEGNGWLLPRADGTPDCFHAGEARVPFPSRAATAAEAARILAFLGELPLVLEREDLRVVHACWDPAARSRLPESGALAALSAQFEAEITERVRSTGLVERAEAERAEFAGLQEPSVAPTRHLAAVAEQESVFQLNNPVKLLTSGAERAVQPGGHFFVGGKWRFVQRDRWWLRPVDKPTVVGHYWRRRGAPIPGKADVWGDVPPFAWAGNAFCVDYSVGRRFVERHHGTRESFDGGLAALRWPERQLVFDDRHIAVPTEPGPPGP